MVQEMARMKTRRQPLPAFSSQQEEAAFWLTHDTAKFWQKFEDLREPLEVAPPLLANIKARHERTKAISLRLYPTQLRIAKALARKTHLPYQAILRTVIDQGLSQLAKEQTAK
jgi:predicted DNA binding CopG/RHH family protein